MLTKGTAVPFRFDAARGHARFDLGPDIDRFMCQHIMSTSTSSLVDRLAYDMEDKVLFLVLRSDRSRVYVYDLEPDVFLSFVMSDSLGRFYNKFIRGKGRGSFTADDVTSAPQLVRDIGQEDG